MQLGKLGDSQGNQQDACKTRSIGLQSGQGVTSEPQNIPARSPEPKPIKHSVYIGRERLGRYVQTDSRNFKAFDAKDRPLGRFRIRARALAAIRKAARSARS
jgi:hypothetical protein